MAGVLRFFLWLVLGLCIVEATRNASTFAEDEEKAEEKNNLALALGVTTLAATCLLSYALERLNITVIPEALVAILVGVCYAGVCVCVCVVLHLCTPALACTPSHFIRPKDI